MSNTVFYNNIPEFFAQMDRLGERKNPFLFGVNYELTEAFLCEHPMMCGDVFFAIGETCHSPEMAAHYPSTPSFKVNNIAFPTYKEKFDVVQSGLKRGDSFLANLTVKTPVETNWTLEEIFCHTKAPYRICLPGRFVCFSPERFVRISKEGTISSNPMKGTISATIPNAEEVILSSFKETAEHSTIVDLIRNDLSMVAEDVRVKRFRYVDRILTNRNEEILQVSSEITGKLPAHYNKHLGAILMQLLPAGSICGAPKKATVELIYRAEQELRGFYTGVFGYFDGETFDSAVMIRLIEEIDGRKYFRSGGGITAYSCCESEYDEVLKKIYLPL